jgi:hypothetical protein
MALEFNILLANTSSSMELESLFIMKYMEKTVVNNLHQIGVELLASNTRVQVITNMQCVFCDHDFVLYLFRCGLSWKEVSLFARPDTALVAK